jgi:hypothetical protein
MMNIKEALVAMNGFFDCLYESGCLSDEEKSLMNDVEDTICEYVKASLDEE